MSLETILIHSDPFCTFFAVETPVNRFVTWFKHSCSTTTGKGISTTSAEATRWSGHWLCFEVGEDSKGGPWLRWIWLESVSVDICWCFLLTIVDHCWPLAVGQKDHVPQKNCWAAKLFGSKKAVVLWKSWWRLSKNVRLWKCKRGMFTWSSRSVTRWEMTGVDGWWQLDKMWRILTRQGGGMPKRIQEEVSPCGCSCKKNITCSRSLRPGSMAGPQLIMRRT